MRTVTSSAAQWPSVMRSDSRMRMHLIRCGDTCVAAYMYMWRRVMINGALYGKSEQWRK